MPRFRFTVRRLMVVVAVIALTVQAGIVWRRYSYHREKATGYAKIAKGLRSLTRRLSPAQLARGTSLDFEDGKPAVPATPDMVQKMVDLLEQKARLHALAAREPWRPFQIDSPEPQ